jgi:predicted ester cyclase
MECLGLNVADEISAPDISFRGSLGVTTSGREAFTRYVELVRVAFPDFHNSIDDLIAEGDKVVARLTYSGTHHGQLWDIPPTGKRVSYAGVAVFRIVGGLIVEGWVLGDTQSLISQLRDGTIGMDRQ